MQTARRRDLAYLLQHKDNPVDWYPWGEEALRRARERGPADPAVDRLLGLPLVPRDGARVVRGRRDRRADERALRVHQARPRGAARPRLDLHGGLPGDDRPGRLAAQRVPHPRAGALLRRHLLPARSAQGMPSWRAVLDAVAEGVGRARATRSAPAATAIAERLRGGALLAALGGAVRRSARWTPPSRALREHLRPPRTAASAARPSSRPRRRSSSCCAAARPR